MMELDEDFWGTHTPTSQNDRLSLLVFGDPGVGKTHLAGTAEDDPRTSPVMWLDAEGGETTISYRGKGLVVRSIQSYDRDMGDILNKLDAAKADGKLPFKTLVIDSLTVLIDRAMDAVLRTNLIPRANPITPEYPDWNIWTNRMRSLMRRLNDLNINVVVTALEEYEGSKYGPMYKGKKITPIFTGGFNTVARLTVVREKDDFTRKLQLVGDGMVTAKDRSDPLGALEPEMFEPTIGKLMDRMAEGRRLAEAAKREA